MKKAVIYSKPVVPKFLGNSFKIKIQSPTLEIQVSRYNVFGSGETKRVAKYLFPLLIIASHFSFEESGLS